MTEQTAGIDDLITGDVMVGGASVALESNGDCTRSISLGRMPWIRALFRRVLVLNLQTAAQLGVSVPPRLHSSEVQVIR
jgi:hypothetical protein